MLGLGIAYAATNQPNFGTWVGGLSFGLRFWEVDENSLVFVVGSI